MEYHRSAGAYPHQDACLTQANIDDLWTDIDVDGMFDDAQHDEQKSNINLHAMQNIEGMTSANPLINANAFNNGNEDSDYHLQSSQSFTSLSVSTAAESSSIVRPQSAPLDNTCDVSSRSDSPIPTIHKGRKLKRKSMVCPGCSCQLPPPLGHGTS